jgi:hypothetical protein
MLRDFLEIVIEIGEKACCGITRFLERLIGT